MEPLLIYWNRDNGSKRIHSLTLLFAFFSKKVSIEEVSSFPWEKNKYPSLGLVVDHEKNRLNIEGGLFFRGPVPVFFNLHLKAAEEFKPECWRGQANVKRITRRKRQIFRSEWGLTRAPDSVVCGYLVEFINRQIRRGNLSENATPQNTIKELETWKSSSNPIVKYLRSDRLVDLAKEQIGQGNIIIRNGKAKCTNISPQELSADTLYEKYFAFIDDQVQLPESYTKQAEPRYKLEERKYQPEGTPQGIRSSRRLRQEEYKSIWNVRNDLKLTKDYSKDKNYLDFTKAELKWAPGIVLLAEHLASIPKDTAKKVAEDYIEDGSAEWFDNLHYKELAVIPSPVFLVACLPHMETEQAQKLAGTERVKKLLDASSITIEEIANLSFPALTAKLIRNFKPSELQRMLDLTPEFKEYLKKLKNQGNEKITEIVEHKDLNLSRKGDRAKQLGHRLTEQVIPKMIKALQQAKQEEGGSAQDMIDPLFDYMKPRSSIHLAVKDVWEEPEGLRELSQRVILRLEKARKQRPELDSSGEYLNAVFHLKNESAEVKFRYVPNLGSIKWQLLRCGE